MDIRRTLVCALALALVAGFAGRASADTEIYDNGEIVIDNAETPYIDEDGNFDAEMAKEFAEQVDAYVDDSGIAWDVWLDELGGQMWAETNDPKAAGLEGVTISESAASTESGMTLVIHIFLPSYVKVWRSGDTAVTYTRTGNENGYISYTGACGTGCSEWDVWATVQDGEHYELPGNATAIQGLGTSAGDLCDANYHAFFAHPQDSTWHSATSASCFYNVSQYVYYTTGSTGFYGTYDYDDDHPMVRWDYYSGDDEYVTKIFYGGIIPY